MTRNDGQDRAHDAYRLRVRETFQQMSDEALTFQSARIVGGIDREECDREFARRLSELRDVPERVFLSDEERKIAAKQGWSKVLARLDYLEEKTDF